jgi:hypothetical protein
MEAVYLQPDPSLELPDQPQWRQELDQPARPGWFKWMIWISLGFMLMGILVASGAYRFSCLLAMVNCVITGWTMIKLAERRSLNILFPIAFLAWLVMGCSVAPNYYSIFKPDAVYQYSQLILGGNLKFQFVIFSFLVPYVLVTLWSMRKEVPYTQLSEKRARRLNIIVFALFVISALVFIFIQVLGLPGESYAGTFLNYTACVPLILGIHYRRMSKQFKIILVGYFLLMLFFFALANARRYALVPMLAFLLGIFFLSTVSNRTKIILILIMLFVFPAYMVIGNTVRYIFGEVGFEDLAYRAQVLKEWKYVAEQVSWADSVFGRFFFTGGHAVVTRTPEEVPFLGFDPGQYCLETAISLIPGKLKEHMTFFISAKYAYNFHLNDYGFELTEEHQVGISIFGHFWSIGGYPFMVIGGALLALMQWVVFGFVNRAFRKRPEKGLFYVSFILPTFVWMSGKGFIDVSRGLFWQMVLAVLFYIVFIWPFLSRAVQEEELIPEPFYGEEV